MGCANSKGGEIYIEKVERKAEPVSTRKKYLNGDINPQLLFVTIRGCQDPKPPTHAIVTQTQLPSTNELRQSQKSEENSKLKQFMAEYEKCRQHYRQHDIDRAHECAEKLLQTGGEGFQDLPLDQTQRAEYIKFLRRVQRDYNDVVDFNEEIYRVEWNQQSNENGVKVSTRLDGDTVGTLIESVIDIPFEKFITILIEVELYSSYTPFMQQSRLQKKVARNTRIGFNSNKFPFLTTRQAYFQGVGYNRLDHDGTLFMFTRSIGNRLDLQQQMDYYPKLNPKAVQLEYKYFVLKYTPICRGKGKVTAAINGDLKISNVPIFLLNFLAVKFGNDFFQKIIQISRKFEGSEWEKKTKEDPALHDFFKKAIDDYLVKKGM